MTALKTATKTASPDKTKLAVKDAIALLQADRDEVNQLFTDYEQTRSIANKKALMAPAWRTDSRQS